MNKKIMVRTPQMKNFETYEWILQLAWNDGYESHTSKDCLSYPAGEKIRSHSIIANTSFYGPTLKIRTMPSDEWN